MSNFKTVLDFLHGASKAANHEEIYDRILAKASQGRLEELDYSKLEQASLGLGEMNILRDLEIMDKFIYPDMDEEFVISSHSLAKQRDKGIGKGSLSGNREYKETFLMEESIEIKPCMQWLVESGRKGTEVPRNTPLYRSLLSAIAGSTIQNMTGANLSYIGECLTARQDMRYMFLKGYLTLMSYNLAVSAAITEGEGNPVTVNAISNITANLKVSALLEYNVVIDTSHFTHEEKWFLVEMACKYPNKRYGKANIYNNMVLEADVVCFISDGITFEDGEEAPAYGSPERMWNMLISIATKLNALDDLFSVVRDFRGLPFLLRTMYEFTDKDEYIVDYPQSRCLVSAVEDVLERRPSISRFSGFFATTKSLISDILLGEMMVMSVFTVLEDVGAFGDFMVPKKEPLSDQYFLSVLRNKGLRSDFENANLVLQEWRGVRGCSLVVGTAGKIHKMATMMASMIKRKEIEFLRPQLLFALPFSSCRDTTWGSIRGWRHNDFTFNDTGEERRVMSRRTRAYCWVMGVINEVPNIGLNAIGLKQCDNLKSAELSFLKLGSGQYDITLVRHGLTIDVEARSDEYEMTSSVFYQTSFPGTRCSVVFDAKGNSSLVIEEKVDVFATETVPDLVEEYKPVNSKVAPQMTFGGGPREKWNTVRKDVAELLHGQTEYPEDEPVIEKEQKVPEKTGPKKKVERGLETVSTRKGFAARRWRPPTRLFDEEGNDVTDQVESSVNRSDDEGNDEEEKDDNTEENREREVKKDGGSKKSKSSVSVSERGVMPFKRQRVVELVDGKIQPRRVVLDDGTERDILITGERDVRSGGAIRGYVVNTPGDGTCGVHAIVQDLVLHGFVSDQDKAQEYHDMLDATASGTWHAQEELAAYVSWLNMGLIVVAPEERMVFRYGTVGSDHNVIILRESGHFCTFIPDDNGNKNYFNFRVADERHSPTQHLETLEAVMKAVDNPAIAEELRVKRDVLERAAERRAKENSQGNQQWNKWRSKTGRGGGRGGNDSGRGSGRGGDNSRGGWGYSGGRGRY